MSKQISKYYCESCKSVFQLNGTKKEFSNPIYGVCWKTVALCPTCNTECDEYTEPSQKKSKSKPSAPACGMKGGCCGCGM
jgi:hypothetical protein